MRSITCIWVTSGRHPETETLIKKATDSKYSHAAVALEHPEKGPVIFEAVRPCLRFAPIDLFNDAECIERSVVTLTEEQFERVCKRIAELEGSPYGIDDCITGGAHDLASRYIGESAGDKIAHAIDQMIDREGSYNCSQTQVEILRAAFDNYGEKKDTSKWTPEASRLYHHWFFQNT